MLNTLFNRTQQRITHLSKHFVKHIVQRPAFTMSSRVIAAIAGGYVLSNLIAILLSYILSYLLSYTLPTAMADSSASRPSADAVMIAMQVSYLIYAGIVMWIFSGKTLVQVWRTLSIACLVCSFFIYLFMPKGLF
jgi:hypothetical protein